jgi:hypothetical protein
MLQYPSIPGSSKAPIGKNCIAFHKYDGSNLRWEFSRKKGWSKFGTRKLLFDETTFPYNKAIPIFLDTMADEIVKRTNDIQKNCERIIVFTEFFGPNSFAGSHDFKDQMELKLFDVSLYKKGFVPPKQFVKVYGDMPQAAQVVYEGILTEEFIRDVKESKYPGFEGVIAKGDDFMVKIKTWQYFEKLRAKNLSESEFGE